MTREEMAKEYADNYNIMNKDLSPKSPRHIVVEVWCAGFEAGRLKWHDLRKGPNDLPLKMGIGSEVVLISYDGEVADFAYYNFKSKRWEHDEDAFYVCEPPPIAWCEIPKYTEE